jgi:uncharacterized membrane protein YcaP (DUF421 family)
MDAIIRATIIYFFLLIVFRIAGKRSFAQMTSFDFVLLLIVAETTQQGLVGNDFSVTNALLLIIALVGIDIGMSLLKARLPLVEKVIDGVPLVIVENGVPLEEVMQKERIDNEDILTAAREHQGLERMDQIKYAILERSGGISIIPKDREQLVR